MILDHYKKPRNFRALAGADRKAEGYNPLCGDRLTVYLKSTATVSSDIGFEGDGCAISTASASLMTEALKGKTVEEAELFEKFHEMLTGGWRRRHRNGAGQAGGFRRRAQFPVRVKCATLAWHTLEAALEENGDVSTE